MPIYAYRCSACGHAKDVLQKLSDPRLTQCPACGAQAFEKQVTAAGFQLKGSGWYATDFKGSGAAGVKADAQDEVKTGAEAGTNAGTDTGANSPNDAGGAKGGSGGGGGESSTAAATPCGGSCACH